MQSGLRDIIQSSVEGLGYSLVDITSKTRYKSETILCIYISKIDKSKVSINDCEKVHRHLNSVLRAESDFDYALEVSSTGVDYQASANEAGVKNG